MTASFGANFSPSSFTRHLFRVFKINPKRDIPRKEDAEKRNFLQSYHAYYTTSIHVARTRKSIISVVIVSGSDRNEYESRVQRE